MPGEHEIYAEGVTTGEGENITSNIVKVYVDRIPTFVSLSLKYGALLNKRVEITGLLVDYYNEPLHGANATVKIGGEEEELTTDRGGYFRFYSMHALKERFHIPGGFSFAHLPSEAFKGKMDVLISKVHVFKDKILTPMVLLFVRALLEKKRTGLKNRAAENLEIDIAEVEVEKEEVPYEDVSEVNILKGVDFEDAYKLLFDTIIAKYRLKKSFTPRELSEKLKGEAFAEKLEKVTELYEKSVFGNVELSDEEGETYFRWIKDILGSGGKDKRCGRYMLFWSLQVFSCLSFRFRSRR